MDDVEYIWNPKMRPLQTAAESSWVGRTVRGLYRRAGRVERVFTTPFQGAEVALISSDSRLHPGLRLEVTALLSARDTPATERDAYLRNQRALNNLYPDDPEAPGSRRAMAAWHRRLNLYQHFDRAKLYVEQALLAEVQEGDQLAYTNGPRVIVVDPDIELCEETGRRTRIRVKPHPDHTDTFTGWGWKGETEDLRVDPHSPIPLPTLGLI